MKKKLLIFITVIVVVLTALSIVACNDYKEPDDSTDNGDTVTRTQIVTNGTFYNASSSNTDDYVKGTVSGWSAQKGSLATSANGVVMGVVDLKNNESFELNKDKFYADAENMPNPGVDPATPYDTNDKGELTTDLQDTNALVIASKNDSGSVYYKNSSSFTLEPNKYYLLQYSVATFIDMSGVEEADKAKKGAWVHVTGGIEYVDSCINTNGAWETHYLYIETNKFNSTTLDLRLWLGHGPEKVNKVDNAYTVKGVAFFDNIICKEVTKATDPVYNDGQETALTHENFEKMAKTAYSENGKIGYESAYYLIDTKMEQMSETTPTTTNAINYYYSFREGSYSSLNTKNFTSVKGKSGAATSEQPSTSNAYLGIVDYSKLYGANANAESKDTYSQLLTSSLGSGFTAPSYTDWQEKIMNGADHKASALDETKALMIYHSDLSALGFTTKTSITIESNKNYVITVWVYVWAPENEEGWIWPTTGKPSEPTAYTATQKIIAEEYYAGTLFPAEKAFADYVTALSDEEKAAIATVPSVATATLIDDINSFVKGDVLKEGMLGAGYGSTDEESENYDAYNTILEYFRYLYFYENVDSFLNEFTVKNDEYADLDSFQEAIRTYAEYRYLSERSNFQRDVWTALDKLIKEHETYNDKNAEYMAKYLVWKNSNDNPYAKVKLTGAGEDLELKTENCNGGWEQLTFYVQGNQLSSRKLTLEYWFGEGTNTEYENLMFGGALFDNVEILEVDATNPIYADTNWSVLSPLSDIGELSFGGLVNNEDTASRWESKLADEDKMAASDRNYIALDVEEETNIGGLVVDGSDVTLRQLVYRHTAPTASVLLSTAGANHEYDIKILPNKAYRFAIRIKTEGIKEGNGVDIALMAGGEDDEEKSNYSTISNFNSDEWKEVVFYILGDSVETNYVGLRITMGSGSRFDTSKYIEGAVYLAVANCTEIKYSEYNASTKSGDEVKSYAFTNTVTASESVTNGSFSAIDYNSTDKKEFAEDGTLTGVATTSNWTKDSAISNTYNSVELDYKENGEHSYTLTWKPVKGKNYEGNDTEPDAYEVYARFVEGEGTDAKTVERLYKLITKEEAGVFDTDAKVYNLDVDMNGYRSTAFRVRGVGENAVGSYSSYKTLGTQTKGEDLKVLVTEAEEAEGKKEIKAGTVYNDGTLFEDSSYKSPYKSLLMIQSNYGVGMKMHASSKSLDANSYYCVSVWVKTVDGAKAAVTVSDVSKVLTANVAENYIGYVGIDTEGKWTQYSFYIKTGTSSSNFTLELALGNPYAVRSAKYSTGSSSSSSVSVYDNDDLSQGTVYFDSVRVLKVEEKEYNAELEKGEYNADNSVKLHDFEYNMYVGNQYAIRNLVYTIDSFDSFEENKSINGDDGYGRGHTPNNYTQAKASDATGTSDKERVYGVYNPNMDTDKLDLIYMKDNTESQNVFEDFMPEDFNIKDFITMDGNNSLVMSNKVPYGQSYTTESSSTISSKSYYKLSFKAKTLLAREETAEDGTKSYKTDNVNAEFRFMQNASADKYQSILVNSYEEKEYTLYIYNPSASSSSAKWAFYLGANADDEDKTGTKQLIIGMMVIDQVELSTITEEVYNAHKAEYDALSADEKLTAATVVYSYDEDKEPTGDDNKEPEEPTEKDKTSVWDRGDVWLLVSSLVIAVMIIIVVVVVVVRRWKKRHPKEVVGENVARTEKEIKVVEPVAQTKEDVVDDEEYSDRMPVTYTQRTVRKGKKKKK